MKITLLRIAIYATIFVSVVSCANRTQVMVRDIRDGRGIAGAVVHTWTYRISSPPIETLTKTDSSGRAIFRSPLLELPISSPTIDIVKRGYWPVTSLAESDVPVYLCPITSDFSASKYQTEALYDKSKDQVIGITRPSRRLVESTAVSIANSGSETAKSNIPEWKDFWKWYFSHLKPVD